VFRQDGLGIKLLTQDLNLAGALGDASRATAGLGSGYWTTPPDNSRHC
jgi:hypothetical protein